jgi:hypothetical protein
MKKLVSLVSASFASRRAGLPQFAWLSAALILPGGLILLPLLWWLGPRRPGGNE